MDSGPDATIFPFGVFDVIDKAEPLRRAPPERSMADDRLKPPL